LIRNNPQPLFKKINYVILSTSIDSVQALSKDDVTLRPVSTCSSQGGQSQCDNYRCSFLYYFIPIFLLLFLTTSTFCQLDNLKWKKADILYEKPDEYRKRNYSFQADNAGEFIKKSFVNAYWFFISDVDGDNCPFTPSCSSFFMDATEETNIFQATLMFSDRLTRDTNPIKKNRYPNGISGHYYDPASNYTLNQGRIEYLPPEFIVEDE